MHHTLEASICVRTQSECRAQATIEPPNAHHGRTTKLCVFHSIQYNLIQFDFSEPHSLLEVFRLDVRASFSSGPRCSVCGSRRSGARRMELFRLFGSRLAMIRCPISHRRRGMRARPIGFYVFGVHLFGCNISGRALCSRCPARRGLAALADRFASRK